MTIMLPKENLGKKKNQFKFTYKWNLGFHANTSTTCFFNAYVRCTKERSENALCEGQHEVQCAEYNGIVDGLYTDQN